MYCYVLATKNAICGLRSETFDDEILLLLHRKRKRKEEAMKHRKEGNQCKETSKVDEKNSIYNHFLPGCFSRGVKAVFYTVE